MISARYALPPQTEIDELLRRAHEIVADPTVAPQQFVAAAGILLTQHVLGCDQAASGQKALATIALAVAAQAKALEEES
jgi:hypothetical protein